MKYITFLILFISLQALSVDQCGHFFKGPRQKNSVLLNARKKIPLKKSSKDTLKKKFLDFKNKIAISGNQDLFEWFKGNLFFDRDLILRSAQKETNELLKMWDEEAVQGFFARLLGGKKFNSPFKNYSQAFDRYILNSAGEKFDINFIKKLHKEFMETRVKGAANIEGIPSLKLGVFRNHTVYFRGGNRARKRAKVIGNKYLTIKEDAIYYPSVSDYQKYKVELSEKTYKRFSIKSSNPQGLDNKDQYLFVQELVDNAFSNYQRQLSKAANLDERLNAHIDFVWQFVSIHPFANGNGRTSRFILHKLISDEGLLPPILNSMDDILATKEMFRRNVKNGIKNTEILMNDMLIRKNLGLNPRTTPITSAVRAPNKVSVSTNLRKGEKAFVKVDMYDFISFRERIVKEGITDEIKILQRYTEHVKKWSSFYRKGKGELLDDFQVLFIPEDFKKLHFKFLATNSNNWNFKMKSFYDKELIHRGLATHKSYSDLELLKYFVEPKPVGFSMRSSRTGGERLRKSVLEDFEQFNKYIANDADGLIKHAKDHMNAQGSYAQSIFLSTSKNLNTAERFSKGFLTSESSIMRMKGQLVLSSYKPKYGALEFNRLKGVGKKVSNQKFSSKYPRQEEVALTGSIDPDAITHLEFKDVKVLDVNKNTGENIAGETLVLKRRVLERTDNPNVIQLSTYDRNDDLISQARYKIEKKDQGFTFQKMNSK